MMKGKNGEVDCLVLPIKDNQFFIGEKGIYLDIAGFEIKNPAEGNKDTHLLKQSFSKEVYQAMTEEEKKAVPILGNARIWGGHTEPEPQGDFEPRPETDDLPF